MFSTYNQLLSDNAQDTKSIQIYEFPALFSPCDQLHSEGLEHNKSIQILLE